MMGGSVAVTLIAAPATADPRRGEGRSLLRDADRVVTTVAGDADASAIVQNPGNLGLLLGRAMTLDVSMAAPASRRRGSGVGGFFALPLPKNIATFGLGLQWLWPNQPAPESTLTDPEFASADAAYAKLSFAVGLPLVRWVPGLSLGFGVHHLVSGANAWAHGVTALDLGVGWQLNRFVSLGLAARQVNVPVISSSLAGGEGVATQRVPLTLDPEIALRPLGRRSWEVAVGGRIDARRPTSVRFRGSTIPVQPRVRTLINFPGGGLFAEAELYATRVDAVADPTLDARISAGLVLQLARGSVAGGVVGGPLGRSGAAVGGGVARVRVEQATFPGAKLPRVKRAVTKIRMRDFAGERGMYRLVTMLDSASVATMPSVLLEVEGVSLGYAQVEEVREALARYEARGGRTAAYLGATSTRAYFLAAAAERVYAHPQRSLEMLGLSIRRLYYGELLRRIGVRSEFVRVAEYKGSAETYARAGASAPVARQRRQLLADLHNHLVRLLAADRGVGAEQVAAWWDAAPIAVKAAEQRGIVDEFAFPDQLEERIGAWLDVDATVKTYRRGPVSGGDWGEGPTVAVVHIDGELVRGKSLTIPVLNRRLVGSESVVAQIDKLRKDRRVVAVVLRVNSPGGSVTAAEDIARALDRVAEDKPVIASFGGVAASGGYFIATSASYIVTDAMTTTGSIGIFYPKLDLSGFFSRIGVGIDTDAMSDHAHLRSWLIPYDEDTRAAAQADIERSYSQFTARVGAARSMSKAQVDGVARGRVFAGVRALEVGLADRYGGVAEAIAYAAKEAGRERGDVSVRWVSSEPGILRSAVRLFGLRVPNPLSVAPAEQEGSVARLVLPRPLLQVLEQLPAALWWSEAPAALAMSEWSWRVE